MGIRIGQVFLERKERMKTESEGDCTELILTWLFTAQVGKASFYGQMKQSRQHRAESAAHNMARELNVHGNGVHNVSGMYLELRVSIPVRIIIKALSTDI